MNHYLKYLFEILVIVIGITLSFMVDEWREEREYREQTIEVLKLIHEDLILDVRHLQDGINRFNEANRGFREVYWASHSIISYDSARKYEDASTRHEEPVTINSKGYERFKYSLQKPVIIQGELVRKLGSYYEDNYLEVSDDFMNDNTISTLKIAAEFIPFMGYKWDPDHFNTEQRAIYTNSVKEIMQNHRFLNSVYLKWIASSTVISNYSKKVASANEIIKILDIELELD